MHLDLNIAIQTWFIMTCSWVEVNIFISKMHIVSYSSVVNHYTVSMAHICWHYLHNSTQLNIYSPVSTLGFLLGMNEWMWFTEWQSIFIYFYCLTRTRQSWGRVLTSRPSHWFALSVLNSHILDAWKRNRQFSHYSNPAACPDKLQTNGWLGPTNAINYTVTCFKEKPLKQHVFWRLHHESASQLDMKKHVISFNTWKKNGLF